MRTAINYARQSDPADNPNFRRRWCEAAWLLRQEELLLGAARERPPRPPDKERPAAVVRTSNRPLVQPTSKPAPIIAEITTGQKPARMPRPRRCSLRGRDERTSSLSG